MTDGQLERLEQAARDRWGDEWAIRATHFADGDVQAYAFHSRGVVDDDRDAKTIDEERLYVDGDRTVYQRVHVHREDVLDVHSDSDPEQSRKRSRGTERVQNSPNLGPITAMKTAARKLRGKDTNGSD